MKNFIKLAVVGIGGYLIGFYEMKYKLVKALAEVTIESVKNSKEDSKEEEES